MTDPIIFKDFKRSDAIAGLREMYQGFLRDERRRQGDTVGFPDMEELIDHIEQHGLPAKES